MHSLEFKIEPEHNSAQQPTTLLDKVLKTDATREQSRPKFIELAQQLKRATFSEVPAPVPKRSLELAQATENRTTLIEEAQARIKTAMQRNKRRQQTIAPALQRVNRELTSVIDAIG